MTKIFYFIITTTFLLSCGQQGVKDNETVKEENVSTTVSTDTAKLAKLIDISIYKPVQVKFKYTFIDNSGQNKRVAVPGPSDSYLQAVLYFDTSTFKNFTAQYFNIDYSSPGYDKQSFNFDWLDNDIRNELLKSHSNYHGHPDYFLGKRNKLWLLNNKLLLIRSTN